MEKESVKKFDLEAAFKALDEIEIPQTKGIKANRVDLKERFNHKSAHETLIEDYYDVSSNEDLTEAQEEREGEVAQAKLARIEKIVDLDAETADDLLPSYVGKVIIQCPQCMTLFYKNPEDIEHSDENPDVVNINEVCQHCGNASGYTLIGKVDSVSEEEADKYEAAEGGEENELDLDFEEPTEEVDAEGTGEGAEEMSDEEFDELNLELEEIPEEEPEEEKKEESLNLSKAAPSEEETEHKSENLTLNEEKEKLYGIFFKEQKPEESPRWSGTKEEMEAKLAEVKKLPAMKNRELEIREVKILSENFNREIFSWVDDYYREHGRGPIKMTKGEFKDLLAKYGMEEKDATPALLNRFEISEGLTEDAKKFIVKWWKSFKDENGQLDTKVDEIKEFDDIEKAKDYARECAKKDKDGFVSVFSKDGSSQKLVANFKDGLEESLNTSEEAPSEHETENESENLTLNEEVDKDLDKKLKAHNDYIEYLKNLISQDEEALKKAENEEIKSAIQRHLDTLNADLEAALPDALKSVPEVAVDELADSEPVEEPIEEPVVEEEPKAEEEAPVDEQLTEDATEEEKPAEEPKEEGNEVNYVDYKHSYCHILSPKLRGLHYLVFQKGIEAGKLIGYIKKLLKDPLVRWTDKEQEFKKNLEAKTDPKDIYNYVKNSIEKAKTIKVKVDENGELVEGLNEGFEGCLYEVLTESLNKSEEAPSEEESENKSENLTLNEAADPADEILAIINSWDFDAPKTEPAPAEDPANTPVNEEPAPADSKEATDDIDSIMASWESLEEGLSEEKLAEFKANDFFKDLKDVDIKKIIRIYKEDTEVSDDELVAEDVADYILSGTVGGFIFANVEKLTNTCICALAKKDPYFIEALKKYYNNPVDSDEELVEVVFSVEGQALEDTIEELDEIYHNLTKNIKEELTEGAEDALDALLDSPEFKKPISDAEVLGYFEGYTGNPAERTTHLEYTDDDPTDGKAVLPDNIEKQLTEEIEISKQDYEKLLNGSTFQGKPTFGKQLKAENDKYFWLGDEKSLKAAHDYLKPLDLESVECKDGECEKPLEECGEKPLKEEDEIPAEEEAPVEEPVEGEANAQPDTEETPNVVFTDEEVKEIATEVAETVSEPADEGKEEEQAEAIKEVVDDTVEKAVEAKLEPEEEVEEPEFDEEDIDDLDECSLNKHIDEYLKEVYSNVKSYETTNCELKEGKLFVEGKISFNSGKEKLTMFEFLPAYCEGKLFFEGYNKDFSEDKAFTLNCSINESKTLITESFGYKYKINENLVEGLK